MRNNRSIIILAMISLITISLVGCGVENSGETMNSEPPSSQEASSMPTSSQEATPAPEVAKHLRAVGDVDGDGREEILVLGNF